MTGHSKWSKVKRERRELDERADQIRHDAAKRSGHQRVVPWANLPEELRERWRRAAGKK